MFFPIFLEFGDIVNVCNLVSVPFSLRLSPPVGHPTHLASSFKLSACSQLLPILPCSSGTKTPIAMTLAFLAASSSLTFREALIPAYSSWMKYLGDPLVEATGLVFTGCSHQVLLHIVQAGRETFELYPIIDSDCDTRTYVNIRSCFAIAGSQRLRPLMHCCHATVYLPASQHAAQKSLTRLPFSVIKFH